MAENTELDRRCPTCHAMSLKDSAGRTRTERSIWQLERTLETLPSDATEAEALIGAAIRKLRDKGHQFADLEEM